LKIDTDCVTIVSGIAESFKPEDIIGKKKYCFSNLAPRNLRGVERRNDFDVQYRRKVGFSKS
jgi:methionyl-tRNA synthetase